jgi:Ca2+-dependent lipid-binding protein
MAAIGFSDPFCEVRVNGRKVHTTAVKKKTLNPIWEENATVELPNNGETLTIVSAPNFFRKPRVSNTDSRVLLSSL